MDTIQGRVETGLLNPLFEARLQYRPDMEVVVSAETREGELVGSGDGRVSGDVLSGNARWSMYASNCAYVFVRAGILPPPVHLCYNNDTGCVVVGVGWLPWLLFDQLAKLVHALDEQVFLFGLGILHGIA